MKIVLMVADRPSLASTVAEILSNGRSVSRKSLSPGCPVHKWSGRLFGQPVIFKMTSVNRHVTTLDFPSKFNEWENVDPEALFSCPVVQRETYPKTRTLAMLAHEASNVDFLILWFNNDKQGENMCFEVIDAVKSHMKSSGKMNRFWRAKFSAISAKYIKAAIDRLKFPELSEALSVDAREEIDLRTGCAFTRFQRKYFRRKNWDLDFSLFSYGLCQIPTLAFCVQRHDEIQNFNPEPYFVIQTIIQSKDGQDVLLSWMKDRCFDYNESINLFQTLKMQQTATVVSKTQVMEKKLRPLPLNSIELIRVASSELGMGPMYTLQLAEQLYSQGYITYPRTESTHYSDDTNLYFMLKTILGIFEWGKKIYEEFHRNISNPRKGKVCGDQLPISPVKLALPNDLDEDSWKLYNFIARHFAATFLKDCIYCSNSVTFQIGTETFIYNWKTVIDAGFTAVIPCEELLTNKPAIDFLHDDKINIKEIKLNNQMTKPPDYLTESELITIMEKHKIGIDSSMATHINNITKRNYITVASGRRLIPTDWGIVLVHGYQKIDNQLVEPLMRSSIEDQLTLIAEGKANYEKVVEQIINAIKQKYFYFVKNIDTMGSVFKYSSTILAAKKNLFSRCGKCQHQMILIINNSSRLHCSYCDKTYNLPKNRNFRIFKELKCPLDNFELITWSMGNKSKSYPLCPYCYNYPGFKDMEEYSGCNQCLHPTCPAGLYVNSVASCLECDDGILVLNSLCGPKWKIECNKCEVIFYLCENVHKISIEKNKECQCGARLLKIEFKEDCLSLQQDLIEMTGCLFCCDKFQYLVKKFRAESCEPMMNIQQNQIKAKLERRRPRGSRGKQNSQ